MVDPDGGSGGARQRALLSAGIWPAAAAGLAAWLGAGVLVQLLTAGAIAVLGTLALRRWKQSTAHPESNVQNMDIGQTVQLESWQGEAEAIKAIAAANAEVIARVVRVVSLPGGMQAVNLKVAEKYVEAFAGIARTGNTLIVPSNMADISSLIAGAMTVVKSQNAPGQTGA